MTKNQRNMQLAVFDIDGTLLDSAPYDDVLFTRSIELVFGISDIDSDWSHYRDVTDVGTAQEIVTRHLGRRASAQDLARLRKAYFALWEGAVRAEPDACSALAGAREIFDVVRSRGDWAVAVATGGWRAVALCKLKAAGIAIGGVPAAFSDDGRRREDIVEVAIKRARTRWRVGSFERVVLLGDGSWDVAVARGLGLGFIGIGSGDQAARLRAEGARCVLEDYTDSQLVWSYLETALPPSEPRRAESPTQTTEV